MITSALKEFAQVHCCYLLHDKCRGSNYAADANAVRKGETCLILRNQPCHYFADFILATARDQATLEKVSLAYKSLDATHNCEVLSAEKYPKCLFCRNKLKISACCRAKFMEIDDEPFERIPNDSGEEMDICGDCDAELGELHHMGCDMEQCPACRGQLISCDCNKQGFFDSLDSYKTAVKQKGYRRKPKFKVLSHLFLSIWHKGF